MKTKTKPTPAAPVAYGWEDDALEVPRGFEPDLGKIGRTRRFYRRFVKIAIFWQFLSFLLLFILLYVLVAAPKAAESATSATAATVSAGRAAATLTMNKWISASPAPLPGGQVISWDGSTPIAPAVTEDAEGNPITYPLTSEVHNFTLTDRLGAQYTASVNVAIDPRGGTKVLAGPSLLPLAPPISDNWAEVSGPWPGLTEPGQSSPAIDTAVDAWMKAMISGDSEALRVAVGDPNVESTYLPLNGVASAKNTLSHLAKMPGQPGVLVGRLSTVMTWKGVAAPAGTTASTTPTPAMFDILIERADTGAPVVTAWGAPGAGATLTRYANATTGQRLPSTPKPEEATAAPTEPAATPSAPVSVPAEPVSPAPTTASAAE